MEAMASRKSSSGEPPLPTTDRLNDDERRMFERELAGVRPWRRGPSRISQADFQDLPPHPPVATGAMPKPAQPSDDLHVEREPDGSVGLAFGVSRQTLSALRRGEFPFEARCDLHKLHAEPARRRLQDFVAECARRGLRAALVICGRGLHSGPDGPVLATVVSETLAQPPARRHILAFAPASAAQGGAGAVAVLFRRSPGPVEPR